jgi:hypothetical protein
LGVADDFGRLSDLARGNGSAHRDGGGSDPAEMSGAWPAYRKLSGGRSPGGIGNRVRERVFDSRVKPAGVGNDHRRRRSGNASCDQLKK